MSTVVPMLAFCALGRMHSQACLLLFNLVRVATLARILLYLSRKKLSFLACSEHDRLAVQDADRSRKCDFNLITPL